MDAYSDYNRDEFHIKIEDDLDEFQKQCDFNANRVLLFPPLNSYRRFLIHKLCEKFPSLASFSVSQGYDRRVLIYSRANTNHNINATNTTNVCNERYNERKNIYSKNGNYLKPNRTSDKATTTIATTTMGIKDLDALAKTIKPFRQDVCEKSLNNFGDNVIAGSSVGLSDSSPPESHLNTQRQRQRRPDRAVYVPRGRRGQPPTAPTSGTATKSEVVDKESVDVIHASISTVSSSQNIETIETKQNEPTTVTQEIVIDKDITSESIAKDPSSLVVEEENSLETQTFDTVTNMAVTNVKCEGSKIESSLNTADKDYNEEKEFQRASKEINRRNRRIIKQTFDSDVLEINETTSVTAKRLPPETESKLEKKTKLPHVETQSNADSTTQTKRTEKSDKKAVNAETDDWESIFDDNGECLDPKLMTEITSNIGKVSISKPKNDYKSYQDPVNLDEEEFPHVLEISNFPVEFKTQDLMMIFSEYKDLGFDIKWVDDTHALVVFSSSKIAARALSTGHTFIKLKPLTQATAESKARAKKSALFLQPYRQRPETCAALARRLVTGALGVRLSTAREEREIERRVLKEAKERKLLAAKLRDEAWEN